MTLPLQFEKSTKSLIDSLKSICSTYGLGGDGNEFKIITQVFLYKFLNDKFIHEIKSIEPKLKDEEKLLEALQTYTPDDY
jgi:type I restriction enzyme M protein